MQRDVQTTIQASIQSLASNGKELLWRDRLMNWFRMRILEYKIHDSRRSQKYFQSIGCRLLAEIEVDYQKELAREMERMKR